ncbi:MAG: pilX, partial [Rhizobacter sp.]|nr:pilX [Rhizobacter sp.]
GRDVRLGFTSLDNLASHGAGWLIHAGASIDAGAGAGASAGAGSSATSAIGAVLHSSGGTPIVASLASNDVRLAALGSKPMFKLLFGQSVEEFSADPGVKRIGPCAPVACGDQLSRLENEGWRVFSIDGDVLLPARSLGSMQNPALIVANGAVGFAGASTVYGLVMALGAWPGAGPARGRIVGAAVSGLDIDRPALSAVSYDGGVLARLRAAGPLLRVPGSWSDE